MKFVRTVAPVVIVAYGGAFLATRTAAQGADPYLIATEVLVLVGCIMWFVWEMVTL